MLPFQAISSSIKSKDDKVGEILAALEATEQGTRLIERVKIEAPWILRRFVVVQARHAHEETLAKLKALLEEGDPLST